MLVVAAGVWGAVFVDAAQAQTAGPSASAAQPAMSATPNDFAEMTLDRQTNYRRLDGDVAGSTRALQQFPARPKDIRQGLEVHDADGFVIGRVAKVENGFAVVASSMGSVEVDVGSFARNKNGLLINLPKAKIDAMMTHGTPAG